MYQDLELDLGQLGTELGNALIYRIQVRLALLRECLRLGRQASLAPRRRIVSSVLLL